MTTYAGMPGPGGSLGKCAVCGDAFVAEILLGRSVQSFGVGCIEQKMFAHDKCIEILREAASGGELDPSKLPESGPLRPLIEQAIRHNEALSAPGEEAPR